MSYFFPEGFLPIVDALAFNTDWTWVFLEPNPCYHGFGPCKISDEDKLKYFDELEKIGLLKVLEVGSCGKRMALTELGGKVWENRRQPNWDTYFEFQESVAENDGTKCMQITAIRPSTCWKEICNQIAYGRIDADSITNSSFGFSSQTSIAYWKKKSGVFVLSVHHATRMESEDTYWQTLPAWKDSWKA